MSMWSRDSNSTRLQTLHSEYPCVYTSRCLRGTISSVSIDKSIHVNIMINLLRFDSEEDFELDTVSMSDEHTQLVNNASGTDLLGSMERRVQYTSEDDNISMESELDIRTETRRTPCFVYTLSFFSAIGGFLFGYDTGVVSGAMLLLKDYFKLSSLQEEIIVSVTIGFAFIFALVGGFLNDFFGRRATTLIASVVFTAGAVVLAFAINVAMLIIGRSILGIGIGLASMTVPVYIAECAPLHLRGRLVTVNNLFITGGQFVASVVAGAFSYRADGWRYMLGLAGIPSAIQYVGFLFLPESPRWLIKKGRNDRAKKVLMKIRGTKDVKKELEEVNFSFRRQEEGTDGSGLNIMRVLKTPTVRRALVVGCGLQLFQQLSGINTVMYYSATIIKMSGIQKQSDAIWLAAGTASINFIFTILGVWLVERIGRKKLIMGSLGGVLVSLVVLAVGFQLAAVNSPPVTVHEDENSTNDCSKYNWCEPCIENKDCGFCFNNFGKEAVNGSCLHVSSKNDSSHAMYGRCKSSSVINNGGDLIWAYEYCPTDYSWMIVMGLALYLMFFAPGMGPMPWTVNSEIYPLWARSTCNSVATATNWISNLLVSMTFLTLTETITKYGTYWMFVGIVILGLLFIGIAMPETKGKKLEDVESLFEDPWCMCDFGRTSRSVGITR